MLVPAQTASFGFIFFAVLGVRGLGAGVWLGPRVARVAGCAAEFEGDEVVFPVVGQVGVGVAVVDDALRLERVGLRGRERTVAVQPETQMVLWMVDWVTSGCSVQEESGSGSLEVEQVEAWTVPAVVA